MIELCKSKGFVVIKMINVTAEKVPFHTIFSYCVSKWELEQNGACVVETKRNCNRK